MMLQLGSLSSLQLDTELRMMALPSPLSSGQATCVSASVLPSRFVPEPSRKQKQSAKDVLRGAGKNQMVWLQNKNILYDQSNY